MTSPDVTAQREVQKIWILFGKKPIQTVKMLNSTINMSKNICTFLFNCNAFCGCGGNCILDIKQHEKKKEYL